MRLWGDFQPMSYSRTPPEETWHDVEVNAVALRLVVVPFHGQGAATRCTLGCTLLAPLLLFFFFDGYVRGHACMI
jgi:hypothetical protein